MRTAAVYQPVERVALPGQREVVVRPMRSSDGPDLAGLYRALSGDDCYLRFFTAHAPPDRFAAHLAQVAERGGAGLVAELHQPGHPPRLVGEAAYELLAGGDGELGITVLPAQRGWLGPYLLDRLVHQAGRRGVRNLRADVLVANRRMIGMLRARGCAIVDHDERPATVRVAIGAGQRGPTWPGRHDRPRLLVEAAGGRWHGEEAARDAGFEVMVCPGPASGWQTCPALRGKPCPLAASADVLVDAQRGPLGADLASAHERLHPTVPLCVELPTGTEPTGTGTDRAEPTGTGPDRAEPTETGCRGGDEAGTAGSRPAGRASTPRTRLRAGRPDVEIVGILQRMAARAQP